MVNNPNVAATEFDAAVKDLKKFCEDHTDLDAYILADEYPIRVQFIPKDPDQLTMFGNDNVDENGEVNDMTVTVGLGSEVKSTLKFKMDSKLLKKLIKLAEKVGTLYYQAFREQQGSRLTPRRMIVKAENEGEMDGDGILCCPCCKHTLAIRCNGSDRWTRGTPSNFCQDCGQAIELTTEPETDQKIEKE